LDPDLWARYRQLAGAELRAAGTSLPYLGTRLSHAKKIEHPAVSASRISVMKKFLTIAVAVLTVAAFSSTSFAEGSCGGCPVSGEKAKDKTEEGTQS